MRRFEHLKADGPASIVLFLLSLPLCLGIAHGSGAASVAGIVSGIVGALVVAALSGARLAVAGPAAGLIVVVTASSTQLGGWHVFVAVVVIAGLLQIAFGLLELGVVGSFVPSSVLKGMLVAIGLLLILKQLPHLVGYDADFEGDDSFIEAGDENTVTRLLSAARMLTPAAAIVGFAVLGLLALWERPFFRRLKWHAGVPAPLIAVVAGVALHELLAWQVPGLALAREHLVSFPELHALGEALTPPDPSSFLKPDVWRAGVTLAIVASLEALVGIAAVDKLDPLNRVTPPNRELIAQGLGNVVCGMLGALPLTTVIARSSANVASGARSKGSAWLQGVWLLLASWLFATWINRVPLAVLAAILITVGYRLIRVQSVRDVYRRGIQQFGPFVITVLGIVFSNMLTGIVIGVAAGLFFMFRANLRSAMIVVQDEGRWLVRLRKDVSFFNKPRLRQALDDIPDDAYVIIDVSRADFIDGDVLEVIDEFRSHAALKRIQVEMKGQRGPARLAPANGAQRT